MENQAIQFFSLDPAGMSMRRGPSEEILTTIWNAAKRITEERMQILERFAEAYLAETGLSPTQVEMIWDTSNPTMIRTWFQKKQNPPSD